MTPFLVDWGVKFSLAKFENKLLYNCETLKRGHVARKGGWFLWPEKGLSRVQRETAIIHTYISYDIWYMYHIYDVYMCIYAYLHTYAHTHIYTYIHIYKYIWSKPW